MRSQFKVKGRWQKTSISLYAIFFFFLWSFKCAPATNTSTCFRLDDWCGQPAQVQGASCRVHPHGSGSPEIPGHSGEAVSMWRSWVRDYKTFFTCSIFLLFIQNKSANWFFFSNSLHFHLNCNGKSQLQHKLNLFYCNTIYMTCCASCFL